MITMKPMSLADWNRVVYKCIPNLIRHKMGASPPQSPFSLRRPRFWTVRTVGLTVQTHVNTRLDIRDFLCWVLLRMRSPQDGPNVLVQGVIINVQGFIHPELFLNRKRPETHSSKMWFIKVARICFSRADVNINVRYTVCPSSSKFQREKKFQDYGGLWYSWG
jgi:hypothetical protein